MTNHSETTEPFDNSENPHNSPFPDDFYGLHQPPGNDRPEGPDGPEGGGGNAGAGVTTGVDAGPLPDPLDETAAHDTQVTLRTPAELADALPYLLGYRPEDSVVLVALSDRDGRGRFGGRARLGIPAGPDDWPEAARQLARGLIRGSERRGRRPQRMVAYVCREPGPAETGRDIKLRLEPLIGLLRTECGELGVPVIEALCVSDGRFWSYCCVNESCCPGEGTPMGLPGTSVLAAAATYAGIQVRGTLSELRARLQPWETSAALAQEVALDAAGMSLVPRILDDAAREEVAEQTLGLAERVIRRFAAATPVPGTLAADRRDDEILAHDEAATLILGLQDRTTRDRAAGWMEGDEAAPALRLWRALARRCVGPYREHAAAPLTLAGWVAWSSGDELEAREALAMALGADPDYLFARLLHQACNEGLDPESVRRCLRAERADPKGGRRPSGPRGDGLAHAARTAVPEHVSIPRQPTALQASTAPETPPMPTNATTESRPPSTSTRRRRRPRTLESGDSAPRTETARRRPPHPRPQSEGSARSRPTMAKADPEAGAKADGTEEACTES